MNANLIDQVTSSGGLSGVDVSDDNDVNVKLFLSVSRIDVSIFFFFEKFAVMKKQRTSTATARPNTINSL